MLGNYVVVKIKFGKILWLAATAVVFVYTAKLTVRNVITLVEVNDDAEKLEQQRDMYAARIKEDSTMLERLKYDEYLEEYARERYHMQREGESVFVVE